MFFDWSRIRKHCPNGLFFPSYIATCCDFGLTIRDRDMLSDRTGWKCKICWKKIKVFVWLMVRFLSTVLSIVVLLLVYWLVEYGWYWVGCYTLSCCVWEPLLHENLLLITPRGGVMINVIVTKRHVDCLGVHSGLLLLLCVCLSISRDVSELKLLQGFPLF